MVSFKGAHFAKDITLTCVRWYVAYPFSYRQVEELMQERGVSVDHATINRWVLKYAPQLEEAFHRCKRPVWLSWRMDGTYIKVRGHWRYLYRAVDKTGQTIDFLLTEQRGERAAMRFLTKAIRRHSVPETVTIDGSVASAAAIRGGQRGTCDHDGDSAGALSRSWAGAGSSRCEAPHPSDAGVHIGRGGAVYAHRH
jgi:putative transposase